MNSKFFILAAILAAVVVFALAAIEHRNGLTSDFQAYSTGTLNMLKDIDK